MIKLLSKPIDEISKNDIESLIEEEVPENDLLEYKRELPSENGEDPWMQKQNEIGKYAKIQLSEEVVAFANADGGMLLVGIGESAEIQDVASEIRPVPQCVELARRLELVFRDSVEPILPMLEIKGIKTDDESGVVVIRVGKSRSAPHRVKRTRNCTIRRSTRCEKLSMREIQDLTLNTVRGLEGIQKKLDIRKKRFSDEFDRLYTPEEAFGFRVTGVPIDDRTYVQKTYNERFILQELSLPQIRIERKRGKFTEVLNNWIEPFIPCRPVLRGARLQSGRSDKPNDNSAYAEIYQNGLLEIGLVIDGSTFKEEDAASYFNFDPDWAVDVFGHLLAWIRKFQRNSSSLGTEYVVEAAIQVRNASIRLGSNDRFNSFLEKKQNKHMGLDPTLKDIEFPHYPFRFDDELKELLVLFQRDLHNWLGLDVEESKEDFDIANQTV